MALKVKFISVLTVLLMFVAEVPAKVYLVSVGISDYPGQEKDLNLPVADARTITQLYRKNTSVVFSQLLNNKATKSNIVKAMRKVFSRAGTNDIVVFFFSGHGYPGGFLAYDGEMDYSFVRRGMAVSRSRNKMIFADACFSGKIRNDRRNTSGSVASARKASVMLFLSSRSGETSIERMGMSNGFFTTYLQRGLRGGADANRDRIITAKELFNYVSSGVARISGNKQHPVMWGRFSDSMPVMKWK